MQSNYYFKSDVVNYFEKKSRKIKEPNTNEFSKYTTKQQTAEPIWRVSI